MTFPLIKIDVILRYFVGTLAYTLIADFDPSILNLPEVIEMKFDIWCVFDYISKRISC